jgi:phosphoribosylaminoimidazole-succinocarboxamide synthase
MPVTSTHFNFPGQKSFYKGKVRDVYNINDELLIMIASDRISAFDVVLPAGIPYKGQVLNQIAAEFLDATADIIPNWKIATPDPMVTVGHICDPFKVEMVIRGYLTGHAWRQYKQGIRSLCGVDLPDGMVENQAFLQPIITPTTKAAEGHDQDISRDDIIHKGIVEESDYQQLEHFTRELFRRGSELAALKGLILVDTKYEFGKKDGRIYLIDELHTPDSSRYFYSNEYYYRLNNNLPQKQLSKEFVREWLMNNGFSGQQGQTVPPITPEIAGNISERYIELYENITGKRFIKTGSESDLNRIESNCMQFLKNFRK